MSEVRERGASSPDAEFLRLEYSSLREEQVEKIRQTFALSQFALVVTGVMWAWLTTQGRELPRNLVTWPPLVIALLFTSLYWALRRDIRTLGARIASLERHFRVPPELAWESAASETYTRTRVVHWAIWGVLLAANLVMVLYVANAG